MNTYICLENLRSLYNVGAIFRTCSFYGFYNVILLGYTATIKNSEGKKHIHEKINKTALNSEKDLNIIMLEDETELKNFSTKNKLKIISIEQDTKSQDIHSFSKNNSFDNCIIIFGNEKTGVEKNTLEISDYILEIKKTGIHNSLNVTTTCGIVLDIARNQKI